MHFESVEPDENYPIHKLRSQPNGNWELGLTPMIFGVRIRASLVGAMGCSLDYCCGDDPDQIYLWFGFVTALFFMLPEDISQNEVEKLFPRQTIKPIRLDEKLKTNLHKLAKHLRAHDYRNP